MSRGDGDYLTIVHSINTLILFQVFLDQSVHPFCHSDALNIA